MSSPWVTAPWIARIRAAGCDRILAKVLAENDNSKNQIYLGGSLDVLNSLPFHDARAELSGTREILKARINWQWIQTDGSLVVAPGAQLILYPQYPEVRLSGILRGVARNAAPGHLVANRIGGRVLLMGIRRDGFVVATVLSPDDPEALIIAEAAPRLRGPGALVELIAADDIAGDSDGFRLTMLNQLLRIHNRGWIEGKRLIADGSQVSYAAANGVGYTLEAELGITPNGYAEPDFLGWEVKGVTSTTEDRVPKSKRITLMTPSPTGGDFASIGPVAFVKKYGYPDRTVVDRMNFGGVFRSGHPIGVPALELSVDGFSPIGPHHPKATFQPSGAITLRTAQQGLAASWALPNIIDHWNRKHARAVYVPAIAEHDASGRRYRYGSKVYLGQGTDFSRMLTALTTGALIYDPGIKVEHTNRADQKLKQRHQFRMAFANLPMLYETWEEVDLLAT